MLTFRRLSLEVQIQVADSGAALALVKHQHQTRKGSRIHVGPTGAYTPILPKNAGRDGLNLMGVFQATLKDFRLNQLSASCPPTLASTTPATSSASPHQPQNASPVPGQGNENVEPGDRRG